ncbi:MAG: LPP20 family lipoprotein [Candidatus Marinimicrobia bacterium]|nr:LPP20 family lipoprotein [Candidatus Neomarinimicrobiota bacterium]
MTSCLLVLSVLSFCIFSFSQTIIPEWFEELPTRPTGTYFAVGYSGKYIDQALAREAAISLAISNLAKQREARLVFDLEEFADGRFRLMNPSFELSYEENTVFDVHDNYIPVDSSITDECYFILIAFPKINGRIRFSSNDKAWGGRPKWTTKPPHSKQYNYGVGIVSNYSSWVRAWKDADEYARFDLGKNIKIEARSIHATKRDNQYIIESKITHQSFDEIIVNSEIVSRWYDEKNNIYYSLCRQLR